MPRCNFTACLGAVIGIGHPIVTEKRNKDERQLAGQYLIRQCMYCGEFFSRSGGVDMVCHSNKVPVPFEQSILFVETCGKGCPSQELSVDKVVSHPGDLIVQIRCNFCRQASDPNSINVVLREWESAQQAMKGNSSTPK